MNYLTNNRHFGSTRFEELVVGLEFKNIKVSFKCKKNVMARLCEIGHYDNKISRFRKKSVSICSLSWGHNETVHVFV